MHLNHVPLFKIFYTFVCKIFSSQCRLTFLGKNCRKIYGKSKASVWRNLSTVTAPKICLYNPLLCSFSLQFIFFQNSRFYGNYSTLYDSHAITLISQEVAYSSRWLPKPSSSSDHGKLTFRTLCFVVNG